MKQQFDGFSSRESTEICHESYVFSITLIHRNTLKPYKKKKKKKHKMKSFHRGVWVSSKQARHGGSNDHHHEERYGLRGSRNRGGNIPRTRAFHGKNEWTNQLDMGHSPAHHVWLAEATFGGKLVSKVFEPALLGLNMQQIMEYFVKSTWCLSVQYEDVLFIQKSNHVVHRSSFNSVQRYRYGLNGKFWLTPLD